MTSDFRKRIAERVAAAEEAKDVVRSAFREKVAGNAPPESAEADREALRILSRGWPDSHGDIESKMLPGQSWSSLARSSLPDFPPELVDTTRVQVSGAGDSYHRFRDCAALASGKEMAHEEGMSLHEVTGMTKAQAERRTGFRGHTLGPCRTCIPWPDV
jgi:hypothetical protein